MLEAEIARTMIIIADRLSKLQLRVMASPSVDSTGKRTRIAQYLATEGIIIIHHHHCQAGARTEHHQLPMGLDS
jgi:hypothetical protein